VAVAGLGLVALDVVAALTIGRGGRFEEIDGHLRYEPSGQEPVIHLYSRSGLPYAAKASAAADPTGRYKPGICTPAAAARLRAAPDGSLARATVNFRRDFLPLITAEMQLCFYRQSALLAEGESRAEEVAASLVRAWSEGGFESVLSDLATRYGSFDVDAYVLGGGSDQSFPTSDGYEKHVRALIVDDAAEALAPRKAPLKAAFEAVRALRDTMRSVIEFQGLDLESHADFFSSLANRFKALVAGPPVRRCLELVALMDAGVVRIPWGPAPRVEARPGGGFRIESTRLAEPVAVEVDHLVRGYLPEPTVHGSDSPLIRNLSDRGRVQPMRYGELAVGGVELTDESHPVGVDSTIQERLWVFGSLTEGTRYFTQYVPSPKSRVRAFVDAEACAEEIVEQGAGGYLAVVDRREILLSAG
jgi:hypothetical protein